MRFIITFQGDNDIDKVHPPTPRIHIYVFRIFAEDCSC